MTTSLARRPETGGGASRAVPAGPAAAGYLLPPTRRGTPAQPTAAPSTRTGRSVALSPLFILLPGRYPHPAACRVPAGAVAVTAPGRSGPRLAREGETSP
jgi:hypothetical protein